MATKRTTKAVVKKVEVEAKEQSLKKVMDRETGEVIIIDSNKELDWKEKYLHCSGKEFNA